jgi:DNA-binding GntR family transcriptional regulator
LLARIEVPSRREAVFAALREAILSGAIPPGTLLTERELGERLGVSRTPVREALHRLEWLGLVERARRGAFAVLSPRPERVQALIEARAEIEGVAARLAAERIDDEGRARLAAALAAMEALADAGAPIAEIEVHHTAFHGTVIAAARNPYLARLAEGLNDLRSLMVRTGAERPGRLKAAMAEHRAVFRAVAEGRGEEAEERMRQHIWNSGSPFHV